MLPNLLSLHLTVLTCTMHALSGPLGSTLMVRECSGLVHPEQSSPHHHHAKFGGFETLYDIVWAYVGDPKLKGLLMPPSWVWRLVNHWEPIPPLTMPILWSLCQTVSTLVGIPRSLTLFGRLAKFCGSTCESQRGQHIKTSLPCWLTMTNLLYLGQTVWAYTEFPSKDLGSSESTFQVQSRSYDIFHCFQQMLRRRSRNANFLTSPVINVCVECNTTGIL